MQRGEPMSSIKDNLLEDMKEAMKRKAREELSVIRMARAAIRNMEIEKRKDLSEDEVIDILSKEVKIRREAREEYARLGQDEESTRLNWEIEFLQKYLPPQLKYEQLKNLIQETIKEMGARGKEDFGKVMRITMEKVKGRADGKKVSELVMKYLE